MSLKLFRFLQVLAALAFLFCGRGILNSMISLQYEIKDNDCISVVDGRNLCAALRHNWTGLAGALVFIVAAFLLEERIIKPKKTR